MQVEASTVIKVDPHEVFKFIAAPENAPRWQEGAVSTRVTTPGPVRRGSEMEHVGRWMGLRLSTHATVTVFEPESEFGYDIMTAMSPTPSRMLYSLSTVAEGTNLTLSNQFTLPAIMAPLAPLVRRNVQRMFERDVDRLRHVLENAPPGSQK